MRDKYHTFFGLLATPLRMGIITLLKEHGAMNVGELCRQLREEQSKVSHSLRRLLACKVVNAERRGNFRYYTLNQDTIVPMLKIIDKHVTCCCAVCREKCNAS